MEPQLDPQSYWITAFENAVLELDARRRLEKITQAWHAILYRIEDLHGADADYERQRLKTALQALGDLGSSAGREREE
jgi:hypothetical protein